MKIRSSDDLGSSSSRFNASAAEDTLRELELQFAAGDIGRAAYLEKKRSLVRLFLQSTTTPRGRRTEGAGD